MYWVILAISALAAVLVLSRFTTFSNPWALPIGLVLVFAIRYAIIFFWNTLRR